MKIYSRGPSDLCATELSQDMLLEKIQKYVSLFSLPMWKIGQEEKYLEVWNIRGIIFVSSYSKDVGRFLHKVENILKGSLDLIPSPSPSVKIQIMGRKVHSRCKGKTLLGDVNKLFAFKSLLTMPSHVLPLHLKQTFPPII